MDMEDIEQICGSEKNSPGIETEISIVEECGVESIPAVAAYDPSNADQAHTVTADIVLKTGYTFASWKFRKKDAQYKAEPTGEEDAMTVNVNESFYMPKIDPFKVYVTNKTLNTKYIVLSKDRNNPNPRILGEVGNGVQIKVTEQTNPKNGFQVEIIGEGLDQKPPFYAGAITY